MVAGLALLPWAWGDYHRQHGEYAVWMTNLLVAHAATAGLLLLPGRRDRRSWLLGAYFLLTATCVPIDLLYALFWAMPPPDMTERFILELPASGKLLLSLYVHPYMFAPAFLWAFARECPRIHRRTRLDDLARRMVPISVGVGCGIWVACAVSAELAWAGYGTAIFVVIDATFAVQGLQALAAVGVIALRARTAPADEVRRVVLFASAFCLYLGMETAYDVVEAFTPGPWASNYEWSPYMLAG